MASSVSSRDRARRDVVLHPRSVARVATVHATERGKESLGGANPGKFWNVAKVENFFPCIVRRDSGSGSRVVYRTVLRAVLSTDGTQSSARNGLYHRGSCAADRRTPIR